MQPSRRSSTGAGRTVTTLIFTQAMAESGRGCARDGTSHPGATTPLRHGILVFRCTANSYARASVAAAALTSTASMAVREPIDVNTQSRHRAPMRHVPVATAFPPSSSTSFCTTTMTTKPTIECCQSRGNEHRKPPLRDELAVPFLCRDLAQFRPVLVTCR